MTIRISHNLRLLAHELLGGHGALGEGVRIQLGADGRRVLWLAHERAPKSFTGVDVTDPARPRVIVQTELPPGAERSNSLGVSGDILAVAYQAPGVGLHPAGFELFDIAAPEVPRSIAFFDAAGPASRGVHNLWFCDGEYVHMASGAPDFEPHNPLDDQFYRIIDVRRPDKPAEVGRWWLPGTRVGDSEPPPARHEGHNDLGFRAHNTNVYPERPDRAYVGFIDAGALILDISDKATPRLIARWDNSPPYGGFSHTVMPLFGRDLMIVSDESVLMGGADHPKFMWVLDARDETELVPLANLPPPPFACYGGREARFGAHNLHENHPDAGAFRSETILFGTFFNAGLRVFDVSHPHRPTETGYFVPPASAHSSIGETQLNDVFVDDRGVVYVVDRSGDGLYILEWSG